MQDQKPYWDHAAVQKTFTHPINQAWLDLFVARTARILDYGCGYGRAMAELTSLGYTDLIGMDFSPAMVKRGRQAYPSMDLRVVEALPTPEPDGSFDAVLLLAVLTSIPGESEQETIMREVRRLLRPGGVLYVSDMPLQVDGRNLSRYARDVSEFGVYGVFRTDDGAVVRHHDETRMQVLLEGFEPLRTAEVSLKTMNGNTATAVQIVARAIGKRPSLDASEQTDSGS
jgi:SAM-dependent methyltransferase